MLVTKAGFEAQPLYPHANNKRNHFDDIKRSHQKRITMNSAESTDAGPDNSIVAASSHTQRERLAYVEFCLCFIGTIGRPHPIERFDVAPAAATRDLALYRLLVPNNFRFDGRAKFYLLGVTFIPLLLHVPQRALTVLSHGLGEGGNVKPAPLMACERRALLRPPPVAPLATLCRAIKARHPLAIRYSDTSRGASKRVIVPFALVHTGLRWQVRTFDRISQSFRDLVLTRIDALDAIEESALPYECPEHDIKWSRILGLELVPHPRLNRSEITA